MIKNAPQKRVFCMIASSPFQQKIVYEWVLIQGLKTELSPCWLPMIKINGAAVEIIQSNYLRAGMIWQRKGIADDEQRLMLLLH